MIIKDEDALDQFRGSGICELCGKRCRNTEPHHVVAKGMGGGSRLDIRLNLVRCGSTPNFECECHGQVDTKEGKERCLRIIAEREGTTPEVIETVVNFIRYQLDNHDSQERIREKVESLEGDVRRFATEALKEAGKL